MPQGGCTKVIRDRSTFHHNWLAFPTGSLSKLTYTLSFGKVTIIQGLTSGLDITSVRNILVSFGFITFCGKLPWGAFGYFLNIFLLNIGSNLDFYLESLETGSKSLIMEDVLFFEESIQVRMSHLVLSIFFHLGHSQWMDYFYHFLQLWIRPVLDLSFEQVDRRTLHLLHITRKTNVVHIS